MGIKRFNPRSAGSRFKTVSTFEEVDKNARPEKSLLAPLAKKGGRNNTGSITGGASSIDNNFLVMAEVFYSSQFIGATYSYHSQRALPPVSTPTYILMELPHFTVRSIVSEVSKLPASTPTAV